MSTEIEYSFGSIQYEFVNDDLDRAASDPDIRWMTVVSLSTQIYIYSSPGGITDAEKDLPDIYHPLFVQNMEWILSYLDTNITTSGRSLCDTIGTSPMSR
jgi:hypothetical protein